MAMMSEGKRWINHYSSNHSIVLVGEGDFSFSLCLAMAFGSATNIVATSLDSYEELIGKYKNARSNLAILGMLGASVLHGVDATNMKNYSGLQRLKIHRIVYNFPHAGFLQKEDHPDLIKRHRRLVSLFLKNVKEVISEDGEIHITHKTNGWQGEWKLEAVASSHRLRLIEAFDFNHLDYPGYNVKYGFGGDKNFYCNPRKTYSFGLKG